MNKASGGDEIPAELFQILKDAVKVLHSICQQIWKTQQWSQDWKRSVFIPISERQCQRMLQLPHNCIHLTQQQSNAQNSSPGFNNMWTENFQMFKLVLEKVEEPEIKLPISTGSQKKLENSRKTPTSAVLTTPKPLTVWFTMNYGRFFKRWEYQNTSSVSWEICMLVKKQQLELDIEQQTGFKLGKEHIKAVYCHSYC